MAGGFRVNGVDVVGAQVVVGAGGAMGTVSSVLSVSTTAVGTDAGTSEKDLWSYTLPANTLNTNNKGVAVEAWLSTANTATTKAARLYFGGTDISAIGARTNQAGFVRITATVWRTAAGAQRYTVLYHGQSNGSVEILYEDSGTLTKDETTALVIKVTGQNGTGNLNDLVFRTGRVDAVN